MLLSRPQPPNLSSPRHRPAPDSPAPPTARRGTGVTRMAGALFSTRVDLAKLMLRWARGDWSPYRTLAKFPELPPRKSPKPPSAAGITFAALVTAWAAESGTQGKALYDRKRTAANLARYLGHDDASSVTVDGR
jgi:hypothetical protein